VSELTWGAYDSLRAENAELQEEIGHLEDSLINQGQMLREIVNITKGPPVDKMHSTHDAVESVERLQARVAELENLSVIIYGDLLLRAVPDVYGEKVVGLGCGAWWKLGQIHDQFMKAESDGGDNE